MASAAPQKRMVSSFFITLASPYRATITQHQHTRAHSATANDMPHTATRVGPEDSSTRKLSVSGTQQSTIHRQERALSESQGSTHKGVQSSTPSLARPSEPRTPASPVAPDLNLGLGDSQQQQTQTAADKGPEELLPPPPPPPVFLDAELTEDSTPLLPPPPMQESPTAPLFQHVSSDRPPVSDQLSTAVDRQLEQSTPSSWGEQKEPSQRIQGSQEEQLVTVETKEVCGFCRKPVALSETAIEALNRTYHASCFQCRQCHIPLAGKLQPIGEQRFAQGEVGEVYCLQDYYRKYAPQCSACQQLIIPREDGTDSYTVECLGRSFHEDCYRCEVCSTQLSPEPNDYGCHPLDGRVLCKSCHLTMVQSAQL
ncbi:unnamed protein product [Coregonus sp. 'balchen']|nr:unnamed protein product [Coregonus sp. 'balchen']